MGEFIMKEITLDKNWFFDEERRLGEPGGFGEVFLGKDSENTEVAIKRLYITSEVAGNRELKLAEKLSTREHDHVIDIYDSGIDSESGKYFIVMAKADHSLQDIVDKKSLSEDKSIDILHQIALGLYETKDIIHRDLKPDNILFVNGKWQIADFGIAKFVEDTTSIDTLKECLTPHYAAPEQWRYESTSKATDLYALGCIAYSLIRGNPPFNYSSRSKVRRKHLNSVPPKLDINPKLQQLIFLLLKKNIKARPNIDSVINQIKKIKDKPNNTSSIAKAGENIAKREAMRDTKRIKNQTKKEKREQLAREALGNLRLIIDQMFQYIQEEAPVAKKSGNNITLGLGEIKYSEQFDYIQKDSFEESEWDVVCGAIIELEQDSEYYQGRSSNLWYMKKVKNYRWYEISYWKMTKKVRKHNPFAIKNKSEIRYADLAASNIMSSVLHAFEPKIIDGEYTEEFIKRWTDRLAAASEGNLQRPRKMPEE